MFVGVVALDGAGLEQRHQDGVRRAAVGFERTAGAAFGGRSGPGRTGERRIFRKDQVLFAADARLDNRADIAADLALPTAALAQIGDAELVFRSLERWGDRGVARLLGAFAFAHWDGQARRLTLGRDCFGHRALFYRAAEGRVAFATAPNTLFALPDVPRAIDEVTLADFLVVNVSAPTGTFYKAVARVPSRTMVTLGADGVRSRHYWSPDPAAADGCKAVGDYVARGRELFDQAVSTATGDLPRLAILCSGGLDSSAIAATAARQGYAGDITCYTGVPPAGQSLDPGPRRYFSEAASMAALGRLYPRLALRQVAPNGPHALEEDWTRLFARSGLAVYGPTNFAWFAHIHDAVRNDGHRTFLSGGQGNYGLSWAGDLSLVELLRGGRLARLARDLPAVARHTGRSLAQTVFRDIAAPLLPLGWLRSLRRLTGKDNDNVARYSVLNPDFIAEAALAGRWRAQGFDPWFAERDPDSLRAHRFWMYDNNQFARDAIALSPETSGLEMRDPHTDRRLTEFLAAVPDRIFRLNGEPRAFARLVLADRLPAEILNKRVLGLQAPSWFRALDARRDALAQDVESIAASPLASRLIDVPRLKRLIADWPADEHAAQRRKKEFKLALARGIHVGKFIRWVEGGNA